MTETVEFRVIEEYAAKHLPTDLGSYLGYSIRRIVARTDDPLYEEIGCLQREYHSRNEFFFLGWIIRRKYTKNEIKRAELFYVWPKRRFEPAGEECGTAYDDSKACEECGANAPQITPLQLPKSRIPKKADFAQTIAGEVVVSRRVVDIFEQHELTGAEFAPLVLYKRKGLTSSDHYQLKVVGTQLGLDPSVRAGSGPFDRESTGRCSRGDTYGLNLLTEVTVERGSGPTDDLMQSKQLLGVRRGLLRPRPRLLMSPRAFRAIQDAKLKGLSYEVAYYADST